MATLRNRTSPNDYHYETDKDMQIRPYQESDWSDVCQVHDVARSIEVSEFMPSNEVFTLAEVAEEDGFFDSECFVACVQCQVVDFVCIEPPELSWLCISPNHHRQGIGRLRSIAFG